MKIFNKEKNQEVAYVQYDDLLMLYNSDAFIPASIYDQVFTDDFVVDDSNRFDFIKFTDKDSVEFFKYVDWMVNYDELNRMDPYEINRYYIDTIRETNNITGNKKLSSDDIEFEKKLLSYKAYSIKTFYLAKYGNLEMDFPIAPRDVLIDDSKDSGLIMSIGIDPNTLLLHKSNNNPFLGSDSVNNKLINEGITKAIDYETDYEKEIFDHINKYSISDDYKYFVIKYRQPKSIYRKYSANLQPYFNHKCVLNKVFEKKHKKRNDNK